MFNKYIVYGCSYKVMIENLADTDGWLVVYVDNNATFYPMTNIDTYQERPYTICKFIRRVQSGQNPNVNYVKGFVSIKKWSGIKKLNQDDDDLSADKNGNPVRTCVLHLCFIPVNTLDSYSVRIAVKLKYYSRMFERTQVNSS